MPIFNFSDLEALVARNAERTVTLSPQSWQLSFMGLWQLAIRDRWLDAGVPISDEDWDTVLGWINQAERELFEEAEVGLLGYKVQVPKSTLSDDDEILIQNLPQAYDIVEVQGFIRSSVSALYEDLRVELALDTDADHYYSRLHFATDTAHGQQEYSWGTTGYFRMQSLLAGDNLDSDLYTHFRLELWNHAYSGMHVLRMDLMYPLGNNNIGWGHLEGIKRPITSSCGDIRIFGASGTLTGGYAVYVRGYNA